MALCSLVVLYQVNQAKVAAPASARVAKCSPSTASRVNPEKNASAMALSYD